jgi:hypothetical protein
LSGYRSVEKLNDNFADTETAIENTLSRDGTAPNNMSANLDMGSNKIINLLAPTSATDGANKAYVDAVATSGLQGPQGVVGPEGPQGPVGLTGASGAAGAAATVTLGTTTTGAPGSSVVITNSGSTSAAVLNFTIPRGDVGATGSGSGDMIRANNLSDVASAATSRTNLGLGTAAVRADSYFALAAHNHVMSDITNMSTFGKSLVDDTDAAAARTTLGLGALATQATITASQVSDQTNLKVIESIGIALSDETTAITTGTAKVTIRMPYAFTLTAVRANLNTASTSGIPTVDINEAGVSILSTKLTIDANEKTSTTAATAAVISDTSLADDAEITFDIDVAGTGAKGLKVWLIGSRT